jgi:hypothetical protein
MLRFEKTLRGMAKINEKSQSFAADNSATRKGISDPEQPRDEEKTDSNQTPQARLRCSVKGAGEEGAAKDGVPYRETLQPQLYGDEALV